MGRVDVNLDGQEARSIELLAPVSRLTDVATGSLDKGSLAIKSGYLHIDMTTFIKLATDDTVTVVFEDSDDEQKWHTRGIARFQAILKLDDLTDLGGGGATFYVQNLRRFWRVGTVGFKGEPLFSVRMVEAETKAVVK